MASQINSYSTICSPVVWAYSNNKNIRGVHNWPFVRENHNTSPSAMFSLLTISGLSQYKDAILPAYGFTWKKGWSHESLRLENGLYIEKGPCINPYLRHNGTHP